MSAIQHLPAPPCAPFNPALPGTDERCWEAVLRRAPEWSAPARPLLVVSPHPDDEVLGAGGLMRLKVRAGGEVTVLCVTDGEAAYPDWKGLARVRRRELDDALRVLTGGKSDTVHLGVPDGQVDTHRAIVLEAVSRLVARRPLLVAPYELDGHPDHDATGEICAEVSRVHELELIRYPIWTWHHATPEAFADSRWGRVPLDPATQRAKNQAIECFTSQLRPRGRSPIVPGHVLRYFERSYEAFLL